MATAKTIGVVVLIAALVATGAYLAIENAGAQQAVSGLQKENSDLQSTINSLQTDYSELQSTVEGLAWENQEMFADIDFLMAAAEHTPDEQAREIYNRADYLADLEVEITIKTGSSLQRALEQFRQRGEDNFFYQYSPDPESFATIVICGYLDLSGPQNKATIGLSGSLYYDDADSKYYLLTAGHIRGDDYIVSKVMATFKNGHQAEFELAGYDSKLDAALLRPKDPDFQFSGNLAVFGQSADVRVLQPVMAMGSPMFMRHSGTRGYVSNLEVGSAFPGSFNSKMAQTHLIVHDARIDAGNSGGPLVNTAGEIVGINVMVRRYYNTWSLAVPVDNIKVVLNDLKNGAQR